MQYRIEGGNLPAVIINLNPGETLISEVGGRTWMRGPVQTETKALGGAGKAIGRLLTGESLFMSIYTAGGPCEIAFTSSFPGRIVARTCAPQAVKYSFAIVLKRSVPRGSPSKDFSNARKTAYV